MGMIELAALRKRARAAGIVPGTVAHAERLRASAQTGLRAPPPLRLVDPTPIDFEGVQRWTVAVCKPSMARSVGEDLPALGFRAYCPLGRRLVFRAPHRSGTRKKHILQFAVFGRYLFVGEMLEPLAASIHEGIVDVIGDSRGAWSLNPRIVQAINEAELAGQWDYVGSSENPYKVGQLVRIADNHPFEHFVGVISAFLHGGAWINLDVFGRSTPVSVPFRKLVAVVG